jgi:A/G-specific adenine glycosylase
LATALGTARKLERLSARAPDADTELRRALLRWYDAEARDLPWRKRRDAYAVWVSEVMLQQTQVAVVLRYWAPFLEAFPTLEQLAAAQLDAVLAAWSGLGYYARARNLHRAARAVVERHQGALPASAAALAELPGFGRYTVGAVGSIAFGLREPVVDGNVARVLSRLFALGGRPGETDRERALWALAERLVPKERPGDWNQALMELGATVCRIARPSCLVCPLRAHCQALRLGQVEMLPLPRAAPKRRRLRLAVAVARRRGRVLLGCRPARGLFGGLWELPAVELPETSDGQAARSALVRLLGAGTRVGEALGEVHRTLTHRDLSLSLFFVKPPPRPRKGEYRALRWVNAKEASALGVSAVTKAALAQANAGATASGLDAPDSREADSGQARLHLPSRR